jgi:hypothetical protein
MELQTLNYLRSRLKEHENQLEELRKEHGDKVNYQKPSHTHFKPNLGKRHLHLLWMGQIQERSKEFELQKKENRSDRKKFAKAVKKSLKELKDRKVRKQKEEKRQREHQAKLVSGLVFKDYWKNCHKIVKFRRESEFKAKKKRENKQRVDDFLKMQSRLADEILREIKLTHAHRKAGGGLGIQKMGSNRIRTRIEEFDGKRLIIRG